ncbi:MAG: hypothetical protein KBI47_22725, partial [Armatimonadetes bacterium]|nr:hypothetical protein [Armatimonadota bacterium]
MDIVDAQGNCSPVEFEWVGWDEPLEGGAITRGSNQTSIDAFMVAKTGSGMRAYLLEWKYCEEYRRADYKGTGAAGDTRRQRYQHLFHAPQSPFAPDAVFDLPPVFRTVRWIGFRPTLLLHGRLYGSLRNRGRGHLGSPAQGGRGDGIDQRPPSAYHVATGAIGSSGTG